MAHTEAELRILADPYVKAGKKSAIFFRSLDIYDHLRFHIDGYTFKPDKVDNPYFKRLIENRRPNESDNIVQYRKENYLAKTKQPCFKVINSLKKIVKSQDWKIDYSKSEDPASVGKNTLEQYAEKDYPIFTTLENWLYTFATKEIIKDPNGIIYVEPKNWDVPNGEFLEPVAKFVKTPHVFFFKENELCFFLSEHTNPIVVKGIVHELPIYILMTTDQIVYVAEIDLKRNFTIEIKASGLPKMSCFKAGGVFNDLVNGQVLYDSFIDPMLPSLDAAAGESSDLQAEVVQHIFSTMWYFSGNDCTQCRGTGTISGRAGFGVVKAGEPIICPRCEGNGRMLKSPFKDMVIGKEGLGETGIPTPPGGYIQKTTDIVSLQDTRIANHIFDSLSSLNMEFLAQSPINQSGIAKEIDRDELNNFVFGVAYHLVQNVLKPVYMLVNDMRYGVLVKDQEERNKMLPSINIPERFDLLSINSVLDEFKKAREAEIDNSILDEVEVDIINKFFNNQPEVRDKLLLIKELDPLRGIGNEEKQSLFLNDIITKDDYVLSTYINVFIDDLLEQDPEFAEKSQEEQEKALLVLTEKKEVDEAEKMKTELNAVPNEE